MFKLRKAESTAVIRYEHCSSRRLLSSLVLLCIVMRMLGSTLNQTVSTNPSSMIAATAASK